jgi:hypothetical protein
MDTSYVFTESRTTLTLSEKKEWQGHQRFLLDLDVAGKEREYWILKDIDDERRCN